MKSFLCFFLFFHLLLTIHAQTTDRTTVIDSVRSTTRIQRDTAVEIDTVRAPLPLFWKYVAGLDGIYSSGNVNRKLIHARLSLTYDKPTSFWGFFSNPKFQYGTNNHELQEREIFIDCNNTFFHAQHDVYGLFFGSYEQSNLRKITDRTNLGIGIGWRILGGKNIPNTRLTLSITNAILREVTDFVANADIRLYRNSTRLKFKLTVIPNRLTVQNTTFIQPGLNSDYFRWSSLAQVFYQIGKQLAFSANLDHSYESFSVQGVRNAQLNATIGVVYRSASQ